MYHLLLLSQVSLSFKIVYKRLLKMSHWSGNWNSSFGGLEVQRHLLAYVQKAYTSVTNYLLREIQPLYTLQYGISQLFDVMTGGEKDTISMIAWYVKSLFQLPLFILQLPHDKKLHVDEHFCTLKNKSGINRCLK